MFSKKILFRQMKPASEVDGFLQRKSEGELKFLADQKTMTVSKEYQSYADDTCFPEILVNNFLMFPQ